MLRARGEALLPKACAECYRRRAKCVFEPGETTCTRCCHFEKRCRPRVVRRERSDSKEGIQRGAAVSMIKLTAVDSDARQHLAGALNVGKLITMQGFSEAPPAMRHMVCAMMLVAVRSGSAHRLHAAACAAAAWGADVPFEWLSSPPEASKPEHLDALTAYVEDRCLIAPEQGACFVYRLDCGQCDVRTNATFEAHFLTLRELVDRLANGGSLLFDAWHYFLADQEEAHAFLNEFLLLSMSAAAVPRCNGSVGWHHETRARVDLMDVSGRYHTAHICAAGAATETACVLGVSLRGLRPGRSCWTPESTSDSWSTTSS